MKYNTLLFDADGTLLDFVRAESEAIADVLAHFSLPESEDIHRAYSDANAEQWRLLELGKTSKDRLKIDRFRNFCDRVGFVCDPAAMAKFYEARLATKSYCLEDALPICEKLSKTHSLYIITNGIKSVQTGRFSISPLRPFLIDIFISEELGAEKPAREYFDRVAEHIPSFDPKTTLVIGDSLSSDIAGGIAAELDVCWYNPEKKAAPEGMTIQYTISKLCELEEIV